MKCEICDEQTATMWVERPDLIMDPAAPVLSCDDCGPQAGYKILAPLEPVASD